MRCGWSFRPSSAPAAREDADSDEAFRHRRFTGIEYVVAHSSPPNLFILHKRNRSSPHQATVTGAFYVLNGNVYQAPSLFEVINERVVRSFLLSPLPSLLLAPTLPSYPFACSTAPSADSPSPVGAAHLDTRPLDLPLRPHRPKTRLDARNAQPLGHQAAASLRDGAPERSCH